MTSPQDYTWEGQLAREGDIAVIHCQDALIFEAGHRMRAALCMVCMAPIGGELAVVIGAAALAGGACLCGRIIADVFLIHAGHLPMLPEELTATLTRGLTCTRDHENT
jgi:hypothetical protein